jgi:glutaredoxin
MVRVLMYTLSTCPWCKKTKKFFTEHMVPFEFVDYDLQTPERQQQIEKEMKGRGERMSFPWVLIGEELVVGWDPERYEKLLGIGTDKAGKGKKGGKA